MLTRNIYDIPYPATTPTDMDEVKDFFDETLLPFLAEKMGLVIRTDLAIMFPDYATNSYVTFLAPSAEADPYLAVYNSNGGTYQYDVYIIAPVIKAGNVFRPLKVYTASGANSQFFYPNRNTSLITLQQGNLNINKSQLVVVDFGDGRRIAGFRAIIISTGALVSAITNSCIYFGPIKMNGDIINTCVVLAVGFNSAWLDDYDQCACSTELTSIPSVVIGTYYQDLGLIYSNSIGKDYLISLDFCIGENAYIPNCIWYSDCAKASNLAVGTIITINTVKYVCIYYPGNNTHAKLLMPEEVS